MKEKCHGTRLVSFKLLSGHSVLHVLFREMHSFPLPPLYVGWLLMYCRVENLGDSVYDQTVTPNKTTEAKSAREAAEGRGRSGVNKIEPLDALGRERRATEK